MHLLSYKQGHHLETPNTTITSGNKSTISLRSAVFKTTKSPKKSIEAEEGEEVEEEEEAEVEEGEGEEEEEQ